MDQPKEQSFRTLAPHTQATRAQPGRSDPLSPTSEKGDGATNPLSPRPPATTGPAQRLPALLSDAQTQQLRTRLAELDLVSPAAWDKAVRAVGNANDIARLLGQMRQTPAEWNSHFPALTEYQCGVILEGMADRLRLDRYVILDLIGAGGMGTVFRARHVNFSKIVALKTMMIAGDGSSSTGSQSAAEARFKREANLLAMLSHPGIPSVTDFGEVAGLHYLVMEFVEGVDLGKYAQKHIAPGTNFPNIPVPWLVEKTIAMCDALKYAHTKGIIHRDIKPSNVMVTGTGEVKLLDLGIAKLVRQQESGEGGSGGEQRTEQLTVNQNLLGTLNYMAPERLYDASIATPCSDVYSLGATVYCVFTGRVPDLVGRMARPSEFRDDLWPELEAVILKMLARDPRERYQNMEEVITALKPHVNGPPVAATIAKPKRGAKQGSLVGAVAALVLILGTLGGVGYVGWSQGLFGPTVEPGPEPGPTPAGGSGGQLSTGPEAKPKPGATPSKKADQLFAAAGKLAADGQLEKAVEQYKLLLAEPLTTAEKARATHDRAGLLFKLKQIPHALEDFDAAVALDPANPQYKQDAARAYGAAIDELRQKSPKEAVESWRRAHELDPTAAHEFRNQAATAYLDVAKGASDAAGKTEALQQVIEIKADGPLQAAAHHEIGLIRLAAEEFDKAIAEFKAARELDPRNSAHGEKAADAYRRASASLRRSPEKLLANFTKAQDDELVDSSHQALAAEAHGTLLAGEIADPKPNFPKAIEHWNMALRLDAKAAEGFRNAAANAYVGNAKQMLDDSKALAALTAAIDLNPPDGNVLAEAYYRRALVHANLERMSSDFAKTLADYQEARRLNGKAFADPKLSPIYIALTERAQKSPVRSAKIEAYQLARRLDPEKANLAEYGHAESMQHRELADLYIGDREYEKAFAALEQAKKVLVDPAEAEVKSVDEKIANIHVEIGERRMKNAQFDDALKEFEAALAAFDAKETRKKAADAAMSVAERLITAEKAAEADALLAQAIKHSPSDKTKFDERASAAYSGLAGQFYAKADYQKADAMYTKAIDRDAKNGQALHYRAFARWFGLTRHADAVKDIQAAAQTEGYAYQASAANQAALWLLNPPADAKAIGDVAAALRLAEKASAIGRKSQLDAERKQLHKFLGTLAIAYLANSQPEKAKSTVDEALRIARENNAPEKEQQDLRKIIPEE